MPSHDAEMDEIISKLARQVAVGCVTARLSSGDASAARTVLAGYLEDTRGIGMTDCEAWSKLASASIAQTGMLITKLAQARDVSLGQQLSDLGILVANT